MAISAWWLVLPDGCRYPVRAGVLIGRHYECDVVIDNELVSRRHALVRPASGGVEIVPLGRNPVVVNGTEHTTAIEAATDDTLTIGDVGIRIEPGAADVELPWMIRGTHAAFSIRRTPFSIGGADRDDVKLAGWPAGAAHFYRVDDTLFVEADAEGLQLNDRSLAPNTIETLADRDRIACGDDYLVVHQPPLVEGPTTTPAAVIPDRVELRILPRGARLMLSFGAIDRSLMLAERRLELVSVLLRPPPPYAPGAFIPDSVIVQRVWARSDRADASDLHVLVHRLRRDLIKVGINGLLLIAREPLSAATRFTLRSETVVSVA